MNPAAYDHILVEQAGAVVTLTINRPARLNALAEQTLDELIDALDGISAGGSCRALMITGTGRAFCAGADLTGVLDPDTAPPDSGFLLESHYNPIVERLRALHFPVIAAVNGAAAGGGCGLALAADIVIASRSAYFLQPFANIGLLPDVGATWLLPRLVGKARATAMMMLGERISADRALEWGMIWQVVDDQELMPAARALAQRLAAGPTLAYALIRAGIAQALECGLSGTLAMERANQKLAGDSTDRREGVSAFLEKRSPSFTGAWNGQRQGGIFRSAPPEEPATPDQVRGKIE